MRILGLGLLVALVAGAIGAGSALASKDPYNLNTWGQYKNCPYENPELTDCVYGRTSGGSEGGEFQYGKVHVKLRKPVTIQVGFKGSGEEIEAAAPSGGEPVESAELPISNGLNVITNKIQEEAEWPTALKESFQAAKKAKETKAFAKIEMAGTECFTVPGCLNTGNLLFEEGTVFKLSLKVKVTSPWLEKLGGGPCYIGSDEHPVKQNLTAEGAGHTGEVGFNEAFTQVEVANSELVDIGWHIDAPSGPHGCGGEYESYVDNALARALEMANIYGNPEFTNPAREVGITWLTGNLHDASRLAVQEQHEAGNPELP